MSSRTLTYQVCLFKGSVFVNFKSVKLPDKTVLQLLRISFDGFGCCGCEDKKLQLTNEESCELISLLNKEKELYSDPEAYASNLEQITQIQEQIVKSLKPFLHRNSTIIWDDALKQHKLIE